MIIGQGTPAPDFELVDQNKSPYSSDNLKGQKSLVVFIPFPFSSVCESELCTIRDEHARLNDFDANVVVITCDTFFANKAWSEANDFHFPVLADFWPHGEVAKAYGAFNESVGVANRYTFVLDEDGVVQRVINTDELGVGREFDEYLEALDAI
jgi:peroxiredoxin